MPDSQPHHAVSPEQALEQVQSRPEGLTGAEAVERLARVGTNELRVIRPVSAWSILVAQLKSVVVLLLAAACGVALALGDLGMRRTSARCRSSLPSSSSTSHSRYVGSR